MFTIIYCNVSLLILVGKSKTKRSENRLRWARQYDNCANAIIG